MVWWQTLELALLDVTHDATSQTRTAYATVPSRAISLDRIDTTGHPGQSSGGRSTQRKPTGRVSVNGPYQFLRDPLTN